MRSARPPSSTDRTSPRPGPGPTPRSPHRSAPSESSGAGRRTVNPARADGEEASASTVPDPLTPDGHLRARRPIAHHSPPSRSVEGREEDGGSGYRARLTSSPGGAAFDAAAAVPEPGGITISEPIAIERILAARAPGRRPEYGRQEEADADKRACAGRSRCGRSTPGATAGGAARKPMTLSTPKAISQLSRPRPRA
jgi:hypothetical protein